MTVKVRHNPAALEAAKTRISFAIQVVQGLRHRGLAEIEKKIAAFRYEFENFDLSTMVVEEVLHQTATDMRPRPPESGNFQTGYIIGPRPEDHILLSKPDTPRLNELKDRISKLEKNL